jgi:hypothetical protein
MPGLGPYPPALGCAAGGFFISTNPDASRCRGRRAAVTLPINVIGMVDALPSLELEPEGERLHESPRRWRGGGAWGFHCPLVDLRSQIRSSHERDERRINFDLE